MSASPTNPSWRKNTATFSAMIARTTGVIGGGSRSSVLVKSIVALRYRTPTGPGTRMVNVISRWIAIAWSISVA